MSTPRRTGSGRVRPSGGAPTDTSRRRQAESAAQPRTTGARCAEGVSQGVSRTGIPRVRQARYRVRLQRMQPRSRESNTSRFHTLEPSRTILAPHSLWELPVQNEEGTLTVGGLSVGDAAGCPKTGRSTSEGSLRIGPDTLATWSSTQKVVALSSAV